MTNKASSTQKQEDSFPVFLAKLVVFVVLLRSLVFSPFTIPSESMLPRLVNGDYLLAMKWPYGYSTYSAWPNVLPKREGRLFGSVPARGDVVIFKAPPAAENDWIKRVIGLPGDTLAFHNGKVFVNGQELEEPYVDGEPTDPPVEKVDPDLDGEITVPTGEYFVMGDNRRSGQSFDSRFWGFVDEDLIVGRAFVLIWPKGHWRWL